MLAYRNIKLTVSELLFPSTKILPANGAFLIGSHNIVGRKYLFPQAKIGKLRPLLSKHEGRRLNFSLWMLTSSNR